MMVLAEESLKEGSGSVNQAKKSLAACKGCQRFS